ncbi:LysR substrate-binding protein (plasmid) [Gemmatirosa kalamazoonensis]|uniref:LysR substrate-binding protein n=1 Tax=Gemmatirosa kalamazoonensis TaxID=861299 RepID=W0RML9_9BACT|nr:LysR substrate-binding domain-containing protein [Gemmatirosa kalamazoonensis]AHG92289.1 LysR substrate-binding protein [Gemmatirosa kalamazoonensis]
MELRHLRYFVAVAEELHFGRAAQRLRVAQPALSQQIKQLEAELGVTLLARTRRRVALTEPGRLFLPEARRTLAHAAAAAEVARRAAVGEAGRLRIGYVDSALWGLLPAVLGAYREAHPAVKLTMLERLPAQQIVGLRAGDLDVGVGPPPPPVRELATEPMTEERIVLALPAAHPLAARDAIDLVDLADEPWVLVSARTPSRLRDAAVAACVAAGFTPRVAQEARQLDALVALVSAGLGVTFVPSTAERMPRAGVAFRPLRGVDIPFRLVAAWRRGDMPPTVRSFLDVMRTVVGR